MIPCPHCHATNASTVTTCAACDRSLPAEVSDNGADDAALPAWPRDAQPAAEAPAQPVAARPRRAAPTVASGAGQTVSVPLIGEEDLPAWLRAFGEPAKAVAAPTPAAGEQAAPTWMLEGPATAPTTDGVDDLEQSWRGAEVGDRRPLAAGAVFARPRRMGVTRPEPSEPGRPLAPATPAVRPLRPIALSGAGGAGVPASSRWPFLFLAVALLIFLTVVVFFILLPQSR